MYVERHAESLQRILLKGGSMAVSFERSEILRTYRDVLNVLRQTYATDGFTTEACNGVVKHTQASAMIQETYFGML